jgi:hypothetical protein
VAGRQGFPRVGLRIERQVNHLQSKLLGVSDLRRFPPLRETFDRLPNFASFLDAMSPDMSLARTRYFAATAQIGLRGSLVRERCSFGATRLTRPTLDPLSAG